MKNLKDELNELNIIVLMPFGSFLYGTEVTIDDLNEKELKNPDNYLSDRDYKGIYLPTKAEVFNGNIKKSKQFNSKTNSNEKNKSTDVDCELYSLQYFLKLACDGDTSALDMLHCPKEILLKTSDIWENIISLREKFYTKNLKSFVDYARGQAAKYGIKGSRLHAAKIVLDFLNQFDPKTNNPKLREIWDYLPINDHVYKHPPQEPTNLRMYEICNKSLQETAKACYCRDVVEHFYNEYGERAKKSARNEGIDWKAISHAIRAGFQLKEILNDGKITYPLKEREFIKKVKLARYSYFCVSVYLDEMIDELEEMNKHSNLPDFVDKEFWYDFSVQVYDNYHI